MLAADVFIYAGDLVGVFEAVARLLRPADCSPFPWKPSRKPITCCSRIDATPIPLGISIAWPDKPISTTWRSIRQAEAPRRGPRRGLDHRTAERWLSRLSGPSCAVALACSRNSIALPEETKRAAARARCVARADSGRSANEERLARCVGLKPPGRAAATIFLRAPCGRTLGALLSPLRVEPAQRRRAIWEYPGFSRGLDAFGLMIDRFESSSLWFLVRI